MKPANEVTTTCYKYGPGPSDEEIENLLPNQKLLLSLLHAQVCRQNEEQTELCPYLSCREGRKLYSHAINCIKEFECQEYMCIKSQEMLSHWRRCSYNECEICEPVRILHEKYLKAIQPPLEIPPAILHQEGFMGWQYPVPRQSTDPTAPITTPQSVLDLNISPIADQNAKLEELDFVRRAQMIRSM